MNNRQVALLIAAVIVIAIMILFPPWQRSMTQGRHVTVMHQGYHWIGNPMHRYSRIDFRSLLWMIGVACAVAVLAYLELQDGPGDRRDANQSHGAGSTGSGSEKEYR
jgi:hypothetical protein